MPTADYRSIADTVAQDIASGVLRPGDRLPPQRQFARRRGIADSTAARVYAELVRRGLAVGEVGRGTYVRAADTGPQPALADVRDTRVDLELNFAILPGQADRMAASMEQLLRSDLLAMSLRPVPVTGSSDAREAAARTLARTGWTPDPRHLLFAGNGRQAIAGAIAALLSPGDRLGIEAYTYPVVLGIASRLGITPVPLPVDDEGLVPEALAEANVRAVYLQPTLHNPLGMTMSLARRERIAEVLDSRGMYAIEDTIYGFLHDELPPLAAFAPQWTVVVDSLSKRVAPGLTVGFAMPPAGLASRIATALRSGGWAAQHVALAAATRWMTDGTVSALEKGKRTDASWRQELAAEKLAGFAVRADPHAYHCWWQLPRPWRADTFVAAAARHGIAVSPAAAFAVGGGQAPHAVRLALAAPPRDVLGNALETLASLAREVPDAGGIE
ncbi:PLP-dependent aminotransferase family protein [Fodinicola acaciae]|uniref:aminotransferase-like domain-containing protein n=1 Tax=Fodinicola acaciae TaxID=2681555 RepID=UPI0013CF40CF|nr:PLP-dependent aminotransferase family protein [Fodinicola acaciae]